MYPWAWSPFHCRMDEYHFCDAFHLQRIKKTSSRQICFDVKILKEDLGYVVHKLTELKIPPLHELLFLVTQYHKAFKKNLLSAKQCNFLWSKHKSTSLPKVKKLDPAEKTKVSPKTDMLPFHTKALNYM